MLFSSANRLQALESQGGGKRTAKWPTGRLEQGTGKLLVLIDKMLGTHTYTHAHTHSSENSIRLQARQQPVNTTTAPKKNKTNAEVLAPKTRRTSGCERSAAHPGAASARQFQRPFDSFSFQTCLAFVYACGRFLHGRGVCGSLSLSLSFSELFKLGPFHHSDCFVD